MARHRRYPTKKIKKVKASDPHERMSTDSDSRKKNLVPKKEDFEEQPVPRKWREIQEVAKEAVQKKPKKKKRPKNKFYELTAKMGFKKRPWETEEMLAHRIARLKNRDLDDEIIKVNAGTAGRDPKEVDADLKQLEEKERRKKLAKIAAAEKRKKQREKEERFRESHLAKHADFDLDSEVDDDDLHSSVASDDEGNMDVDDNEAGAIKKPAKKQKKNAQQSDEPPKKRLSANEKVRLKKKTENENRKKHLMLNAREVIPFGEVVHGPPKFTNGFKKTLDPLFSQAGKKDLLLKKILKNGAKPDTQSSEDTEDKRPKITELDRLRAIQAYRQLKKQQQQKAD